VSSRGAQAVLLVALAAAWGLGMNLVRREPLPLRGALTPPPPPETGAGLPAIAADAALFAFESGAFFVDTRDRAVYEQRRVAGAVSVPADDFQARYFDVVAGLGADAALVVYGAGADSFAVRRVAQELRDLGHTDVQLVVCGLDSLLARGLDASQGPEGTP
jgi:rhodanese-related sulfurtransferase